MSAAPVDDRAERQYPGRPIVAVGAVVVVDEAVVLVRRAREPLAGKWSLPGGAVELGETLAASVAREVLEETGLEVQVGEIVEVLDRIHHDDEGRVAYHYVLVDYLCRSTGGDLRAGSDASEVALARAGDLATFGIPEATRRVIERGLALAGHP